MTNLDDQHLVAQAQQDPQAFAALYDRYVNRIYAYTYRRTGDESMAADITSATFEKALRHIRRYRWQGRSFAAWLYRIAHNELAQHYRRERLRQALNRLLSGEQSTDSGFQEIEQRDVIQAALARLSRADREIIRLRFFEDLTSEEVSEILGCSKANVYLRLYRALQRLRKQLSVLEIKGAVNVTE